MSTNINGNVNGNNGFADWENFWCKNRLKVLIVDDNFVERIVWPLMIRTFGADALVAVCGKEVIDRVGEGERFDIIFMDRYMPFMNGLETTRILRSMGFQNKIVGVGSAGAEEAKEAEKRDFMANGADDYVVKPIERHEFASILMEVDAKYRK